MKVTSADLEHVHQLLSNVMMRLEKLEKAPAEVRIAGFFHTPYGRFPLTGEQADLLHVDAQQGQAERTMKLLRLLIAAHDSGIDTPAAQTHFINAYVEGLKQ